MVWLNLKAERRRYSTDHGNTLLGFLPARSEELNIQGENAGVEKDVSQYGCTSSEIVPLETTTLPSHSSGSRKKQTSVLSRGMLSLCEPLRKCTKTGFEIAFEENSLQMLSNSCVRFLLQL